MPMLRMLKPVLESVPQSGPLVCSTGTAARAARKSTTVAQEYRAVLDETEATTVFFCMVIVAQASLVLPG